MLNLLLAKPVSRDKALYAVGRSFGLFSKDSFVQYKYLFEEDQDNEISNFLSSVLQQLGYKKAVLTDENDNVRWNENFQIDSFLQMQQKRKEEKARLAQDRARAKSIFRKYITTYRAIDDDGLALQIEKADLDTLSFTTKVMDNVNWSHVFSKGYSATWNFSAAYKDMMIFEAESQFSEASKSAQNLLYVYNDGRISVERDS